MAEIKQVIVMRTDLMMTKGKMIAQGAHASMAVITQCLYQTNTDILFKPTEEIRKWIFGQSFTKICVRIDSEEELDKIYKMAQDAGIVSALIVDSGRTMFGGIPTKTCCAIGPDYSIKIDQITGNLKLL